MAGRLAHFTYALVYPAVLGSALFGVLQQGVAWGTDDWLRLVMLAYFSIQFCESLVANEAHGATTARAAIDLGEVALMVLVFAHLGGFGVGTWVAIPLTALCGSAASGVAMAAAFAYAPLMRALHIRAAADRDRNGRSYAAGTHLALAVLSLAAVAGAVLYAADMDGAGAWMITVALAIYCVSFVAPRWFGWLYSLFGAGLPASEIRHPG